NAVYGETCKVQVQMRDGSSFVLDNVRYVLELRRNLISLGTLEKDGFTVNIQSGKIKVIKGSLMVLSRTRRANCVYTLDGQAVTMKTLKGLQQQNGLVEEINVTLLAKVRCFLIQSGLSKTPIDMLGLFGWLASKRQGMLEPVKVKCIFLGYRKGVVGNKDLEEDHTFEVEPHGNVDHVAGSQKVQTRDLIYYHLARDMEQHSTHELFSYREDSNEAAFAVAEAEKIYAHESLTFNNTVACEVISNDDNDVYYWEYTLGLLVKAKGNVLGMKIVRDQSGNTPRVSQSRFYNGKLIQTLLEGHSILSLEGSLSGDCDVEKNGKWSCIYVVGSQEYQMVCTRLDIASANVGSVKANLQHMEALSTTEAGYMTFTEAWKKEIWLKGLLHSQDMS
ncbi:hypothetical protein Tco_1014788, partial [Tanacetum coccineum]